MPRIEPGGGSSTTRSRLPGLSRVLTGIDFWTLDSNQETPWIGIYRYALRRGAAVIEPVVVYALEAESIPRVQPARQHRSHRMGLAL